METDLYSRKRGKEEKPAITTTRERIKEGGRE